MTELTNLQKQVLDLFKESSLKNKFYWTGGTALATFYLHHRKSEDLDFFSDKPINRDEVVKFIRHLKKSLKLPYLTAKKIFDRYEFLLENKGKLRLEFVFYEHSNLEPRKKWKGIFIDSLDDIAVNKLMAFFDRNDPKDLADIYFLLTKGGYKIRHLLKLVKKKFGVEFEEGSVWSEAHKSLESLNELKPLLIGKPKEIKKVLKDIEDYFLSHSHKYLERRLK